jgi:carboxyl-terminal processing protease
MEDKQEVYLKVGKKRVMLKSIRTVIFGLAVLLIGIGIGYGIDQTNSPLINLLPKAQSTQALPLERQGMDFSLFWQVWDELDRAYIDPEKINTTKMINGAIQGMTAALGDPYTMFLPPQENQQAKEDLSGEFDGIGVQLGYKQNTLAVQTPLDGHPAIKQGVKAGDLILHIKDEAKKIDQDTSGLSLPEAVTLIRGKKGTPVTLSLYREGKGQWEVTIIRDTIIIPSVELEIGNWEKGGWQKSDQGTVAWLKVRRFGDQTQPQWDTAIQQILNKQNSLKGIILDLRNNPGGYLEGAVSLASEFIPEGKVVEQQGRLESKTYTVNRRGRLIGEPLVILINGGSASASEILAGALRDRLQTKLVGERSFGKGTVQEAIDIGNKAGLHVTTAKWLLPNGDWIHEEGLKPDLEVKLPESDAASASATIIDTQLETAVKQLNR